MPVRSGKTIDRRLCFGLIGQVETQGIFLREIALAVVADRVSVQHRAAASGMRCIRAIILKGRRERTCERFFEGQRTSVARRIEKAKTKQFCLSFFEPQIVGVAI